MKVKELIEKLKEIKITVDNEINLIKKKKC